MNPETAWLKPSGPDVLVRYEDPGRGHIPSEGADCPLSSYYRRRLADGDLVKGRRPKAEPAKKGD